MEVCIDFLNWLDPDISVQILMYLEDPSDLVHVSSVSRSWRDFAYTWRASYWSSKGQSNPAVPETLIYKLKSEFCVITEINICPFQELLSSLHIYSSNSVRFRMGHPKGPNDLGSCHLGDSLPCNADDTFIWTYTSPEFPMAQEGCLQNFRLPEPVLCIGGILQIELLGRVQRHEMDGLFYICIAYVQVVGRSLSPTFCVEILKPSGTFVLKNDTQGKFYTPPSLPKNEAHEISDDQLQIGFSYWQHFVNILEGNEHAVEFIDEYESGEEEDEAEVSEHVATKHHITARSISMA